MRGTKPFSVGHFLKVLTAGNAENIYKVLDKGSGSVALLFPFVVIIIIITVINVGRSTVI